MDQQAEKDKTERVTGLGRRTREEITKWNQMTALIPDRGGGGDIRHPRPPFRVYSRVRTRKQKTTTTATTMTF